MHFIINVVLKLAAIFVISVVNISTVQANVISGTISLPSGKVAPSGGLSVTVRSLFFDRFGFGRDTVTISAGQSSVNYSLIFSDDTERRVLFECDACASIGVTGDGGWSNSNGVVGDFSAQVFSGDRNHNVSILLETADVFKGTMSLPTGLTANGDEFLFVSISSTDLFSFDSFSDGELLDVGQTSFDFSIGVPTTGTRRGWRIRFSCVGCEERIESESHYAKGLKGGAPTLLRDSAFEFVRNSNYSNIRLNLIDNKPVLETEAKFNIAPILMLLDDE